MSDWWDEEINSESDCDRDERGTYRRDLVQLSLDCKTEDVKVC